MVPGATIPLADARNISLSRTYAYIAPAARGIAIVDVERPSNAAGVKIFRAPWGVERYQRHQDRQVASGQYGWLADGKNGLKVIQLFSPETTSEFYGFSPRPCPS